VLSSKHERIVRNDNTVTFKNLILQLPTTPPPHSLRPLSGDRPPIYQNTLGVSYQGRLLARYDSSGAPLQLSPNNERATAAQRFASQAVQRIATQRRTRTQNPHFSARTPTTGESAGGKIMVGQP